MQDMDNIQIDITIQLNLILGNSKFTYPIPKYLHFLRRPIQFKYRKFFLKIKKLYSPSYSCFSFFIFYSLLSLSHSQLCPCYCPHPSPFAMLSFSTIADQSSPNSSH